MLASLYIMSASVMIAATVGNILTFMVSRPSQDIHQTLTRSCSFQYGKVNLDVSLTVAHVSTLTMFIAIH
jgi:hypothetical protein